MKIKNKPLLLLPILALLLTSCATTFIPNVEEKYPPKPEAYEMHVIEGYIDRPYKKIGMIETVEYFEMTSALGMLKKDAREAGADAVINVKYVAPGGVVAPVGNKALWASGMKAIGEAIVFTASPEKKKASKVSEDTLPGKSEMKSQEKSIEERLTYLKRLYEKDLINEDEYQKKRAEILDQL